MNFDSILKNRYSAKKYGTKKISLNQVMTVCEAARYSPMAGNIYTVRIIVVDDKKKKDEIAESALRQYFIADAPYILVICSDIKNLSRSYENQAEKYARQQAGAAIENMLLRATSLGLASCWVGAFDEEKVKTILHIPDNIYVEALVPLGNQFKKEAPKRKPDLKMIAFFNDWNQTQLKPTKKVEAR